MPKTLDSYLADRALTRQLYLMRFSAGEKKKVLAVLVQMQKELRLKLLSDLSDFSKARVKALLRECEAIIVQGYNGIQASLDFSDLADHVAETTIQPLTAIGLEASLPTVATMKALVNGSVIEGHVSGEWWAAQMEDTKFKFAGAVRQGIAQNETIQQIVRRVVGLPVTGANGIMALSKRNAANLVGTSVMQVAGDARMATYEANSDVMKGYRWLSTLDGHVCPLCVARSGMEWDLQLRPINGNKIPFHRTPLHFGPCRCAIVPITKTYRELGLDRDEVPVGTRASDEGQVRADITMAEWLKSKPKEYVDDLLGPGRAKLFLDGKITLSQLVDGSGRELTLEELKAL